MLSLKHHLLFWVLSFLTAPLALFQKRLATKGLLSPYIDDDAFPLVAVSLCLLARMNLLFAEREEQLEAEETVTFTGLVTPANLDEPLTKDKAANGNAHGKKVGYHQGGNGEATRVQYRLTREQGESTRQGENRRIRPPPFVEPRPLPPGVGLRPKRNPGFFERWVYGRKVQQFLDSWTPSKRTCLYITNKCLLVPYFVSVALLCTRMLSLLKIEYDSEGISSREAIDQVLVSFIVLGTLEPIRRNGLERWDIESRGVGMLWFDFPVTPEGSAVTTLAIGVCAVTGIEVSLFKLLGRWHNLFEWWFIASHNWREMYTRIWLLSPLIDIAETAVYTIARFTHPAWHKRRLELVQIRM
ncbi:hypothetical protein F66182_6137 [Fusarium sp. NRRL 66182]|nr:hypothetical protein F66182_6137 [Fusarium sp. NRRL 66182]